MAATEQISIVLSGGESNVDQNLSLGGDPSSTPIVDNTFNNLFDNISADDVDNSHTDHRCIYYFNDSARTLFDNRIFISDISAGGASPLIGVESNSALQRITISEDAVTGGSMTLSIEGFSFVSAFDSDLGAWAVAMQDSINGLDSGDLFTEVTVSAAQISSEIITFDVFFGGVDGSRSQDQFLVSSNDLVPTVDIDVVFLIQGAPVNTIAPLIDAETTPPTGVSFFLAIETSPIILPQLRSGEGFPLWIRRTVTPDVTSVEEDEVSIRFQGENI